jgi:hypothetical protein
MEEARNICKISVQKESFGMPREKVILKWILAKLVVKTHDKAQGQATAVVVIVVTVMMIKNHVPLEQEVS